MRKWLAIGIILLFIGTAITAMAEPSSLTPTKTIISLHESSRDKTELHYYDPTLFVHFHVWISWPPCHWKEAIRLTQAELAPFKTWNLTEIVIGFDEQWAAGPMYVRIYVYGNGTAAHPGSVIVSDTTATLVGSSWLFTVPLVTPVSLAGYDEIWVAVEWNQTYWSEPGYAIIDLGPAVSGKGDWLFFGDDWSEIPDGNWLLGAIVEGINKAPNPPTITGSSKGDIGTAYTYHFTTVDPEGSHVYYFIDWGDKSQDYWLGPYSSGDTANVSHTWNERGSYTIRAKAMDFLGNESEWGTLQITMPLSYEPPHLRFLDWLFERFLNAFPILQYLMER